MKANNWIIKTLVTSFIFILSILFVINDGYSQVVCRDNYNIYASFPLPADAEGIKVMYEKGFNFLNFTINKKSFLSWLGKCYFVRHNLLNRLEVIKKPLSVPHLDEIEGKAEYRKIELLISDGSYIILTAETYAFSVIFDNITNRTYIEIFNPLLSSLGCYYRTDYFFIPENAKNVEIKKQENFTYIIFNLDEVPLKSWLKESGFIFDTQVIKHMTSIKTLIRNKDNIMVNGKRSLNKGYKNCWNYDQDDKGSIYYDAETKVVHVKFYGEFWGGPFRKKCLRDSTEKGMR